MKRKYFIIGFIVIFIFLISIIYKDIYYKWTSPPSDKWTNHLVVGEDNVSKELKMVKFQNSFYILYDSGNNLKLLVVDEFGNKFNEKVIEIKDNVFFDINLMKNENDIILNWVTVKDNARTLNNIVLDKNLKEKNNYKIDNVIDSYQVSENAMIIKYKDKLEFVDFKENIRLVKNCLSGLVNGIITKDGYLVAYQEGEEIKYFYIKGGILENESTAFKLKPIGKNIVPKMLISSDEKNVYIVISRMIPSENEEYSIYTINKVSKEMSNSDFKTFGIKTLYNLKPVSSLGKSRFLAETSRRALMNNKYEIDIIDFYINEGKIENLKFATKTINNSSRGYISDGNMIFYNYSSNEKGNICMTSEKENFKEYSNVKKKGEIKNIIGVTISQIFLTFFYSFLQGIGWISVGIVSISLVSFIFYDTCKRLQRRISFGICYALMSGTKIYTMYKGMYIYKMYVLPKYFQNPIAGLTLMLLISILCFTYCYGIYSKDTEKVPILSFVQGLVIDTFLSSLMFIPFLA